MENRNKEIKQFIDEMPDDYGFSKDDAKYIAGYTDCQVPPFVFNTLILDLVKEHYPYIDMVTNSESIRALCYGYGSLAVLSNTNAIIKSYQEDYYCYRVTQALHYNAVANGEQSVTFRNMADYFTNYQGNNQKYNVVIVFPHETEYHRIDKYTRFAKLSSFAYYTFRGSFFLRDSGVLVSIVPKEYGQEILSNKDLLQKGSTITVHYEGDYAIVKITK